MRCGDRSECSARGGSGRGGPSAKVPPLGLAGRSPHSQPSVPPVAPLRPAWPAGGNMVDVFSGRLLVSKNGRSVDPEEALQNKVVGLYFSAGWCSPCRDFTPILCDFYKELLEGKRPPAPFEVVFISSDHSAEEMAGYMNAMHGDWLALPFHDPYKHDLKKKYNITAIPKLVIVKQTGEVITDKGRKQIRDKGLSCFRNWLEVAEIFQNFSS
uniref:Uncharacterized protein n=2 Tax=Melopsittacus undulatus TaxID=13146 RepID=A0A8C6NDB5_MELUD